MLNNPTRNRLIRGAIERVLGALPREPQVRNEAVDRLLDERIRPVAGLKIRSDRFAQSSELGRQEPFPEPLGSPKFAVRTRRAYDATTSRVAIVTSRVNQRRREGSQLTGDVVEDHAVPWFSLRDGNRPIPDDDVEAGREGFIPARPVIQLVSVH